MNAWQEDLLFVAENAKTEGELFSRVEAVARELGFEHCAYGLRIPLSFTNPKIITLNNYPRAWRERYTSAGYVDIDPTVLHGGQSSAPLIWSDAVFASAKQLWDEAQSFGLRVGWAQSSLDRVGIGGMLTLSRSHEPLTASEIVAQEKKMKWLVHVVHMALSRLLSAKRPERAAIKLTAREVEILKWTADGKSSQDIADILLVSKNTIDFHVKNAVAKLQTANKTAAVVRAAVLGLLI